MPPLDLFGFYRNRNGIEWLRRGVRRSDSAETILVGCVPSSGENGPKLSGNKMVAKAIKMRFNRLLD